MHAAATSPGTLLRSSILILSLLPLSGCSLWDHFVSPGRIDRSNLAAGVQVLKTICDSGNCEPSIAMVGHAAASYREYPMNFTDHGEMVGNTRYLFHIPAASLSCLIDNAFKGGYIQGAEIDLQKAPDGHPLCAGKGECIYVMHNLIDWEKLGRNPDWPALRYFRDNSMQKILAHYLESPGLKATRLFLELKSEAGCTAASAVARPACTELSRRLASEIRPFLKSVASGSSRLTFTSFSAAALQALYDNLEAEERSKVGFALLAGMYGISGFAQWTGQAKGYVPYFDESYRNFIIRTGWLDSVWFSPQAIPGFNSLFSDIYRKRNAACKNSSCRPLSFSVSSYQLKPSAFIKAMTAEKISFPLASIMIDVDDRQTPVCKTGTQQ